jgi:rhodanese-related sulfurtransferase
MARLCARPGCSAPAAAMFNFDGLNRIVWLNSLAEAAAYSAGDLCRQHADRLRPPRNWELRDCRPTPNLTRPGAPAPSRHLPPGAAPRVAQIPPRPAVSPAPRRPVPAAAALHERKRPVRPRPTEVTSSTPMLERAFRGVRGA